MFENNENIQDSGRSKDNMGELYLRMRLLLKGHGISYSNSSVRNNGGYNFLCKKDGKGNSVLKADRIQIRPAFF